ncbi:MAG: acyltransferase [Actinobacteria bacterium]|nr:acyltransferase [Actinomycetota bacterium]
MTATAHPGPKMPERLKRLPWSLAYRQAPRAASFLRRIAVVATHQHCRVEFLGPVRLGPGFHLEIPDRGTLIVGRGVDLRRGFVCEISNDGRVTIGDGCIFTSNALIQCTTSIDIGPRCIFAQSALIVDGSHRFRDPDKYIADQGYNYRPIRIGEGVAVMAKCTIFADIGDHTMVGANSVVSRDLPARCLAFGAPARPVEMLGLQ